MSLQEEHVVKVCKRGKGPATCRYLTFSTGFCCAKLDPDLKAAIDKRSAEGTMGSKGDNCEGKPN